MRDHFLAKCFFCLVFVRLLLFMMGKRFLCSFNRLRSHALHLDLLCR